VRMGAAREPFGGDPSVGTISSDNYRTFAVMLVSYSMDYICPIGVALPCDIMSLLPVYPKGQSSGSKYTMTAEGTVVTASPDSQGVMMWQTALDERIGIP